MDGINARQSIFNAYKNNDEDYIKTRPARGNFKTDAEFGVAHKAWEKKREDDIQEAALSMLLLEKHQAIKIVL
jgi:hypothetical protein